MNLSDLFTYTDADLSLSQEDEVQAIQDAKAGDESAKERLLFAYGPALRAAVGGNFRLAAIVNPNNGTNRLDVEDLQATAVLAFFEILEDHDPEKGDRLAGMVATRLARELVDYATTGAGFSIPERTLSRYYGILREADGDVEVALEIAPERHMKRETFRAVMAAVRPESLNEVEGARDEKGGWTDGGQAGAASIGSDATDLWDGGRETIADVEDAILVEEAFRAVDDDEARIVELAYGFRGTEDYAAGDPVPDAAIAPVVGLTRPTVQRRRAGALDKMRKALGALEEGDWKE